MNLPVRAVPVLLVAISATACGGGGKGEALCIPAAAVDLDAAAENTVAVAIYNNLTGPERKQLGLPIPEAFVVGPDGSIVVQDELDFGAIRGWLGSSEPSNPLGTAARRNLAHHARFQGRLFETVPQCDP